MAQFQFPQYTLAELCTKKLQLATDPQLTVPDKTMLEHLVKIVNKQPFGAAELCKAMSSRIVVKERRVVLLTLTVLEVLVDHCNPRFHSEISHKDFLAHLQNVVHRTKFIHREKLSSIDFQIETKTLQIIQSLAKAFDSSLFPTFMEVYKQMKDEGAEFPNPILHSFNPTYTLQGGAATGVGDAKVEIVTQNQPEDTGNCTNVNNSNNNSEPDAADEVRAREKKKTKGRVVEEDGETAGLREKLTHWIPWGRRGSKTKEKDESKVNGQNQSSKLRKELSNMMDVLQTNYEALKVLMGKCSGPRDLNNQAIHDLAGRCKDMNAGLENLIPAVIEQDLRTEVEGWHRKLTSLLLDYENMTTAVAAGVWDEGSPARNEGTRQLDTDITRTNMEQVLSGYSRPENCADEEEDDHHDGLSEGARSDGWLSEGGRSEGDKSLGGRSNASEYHSGRSTPGRSDFDNDLTGDHTDRSTRSQDRVGTPMLDSEATGSYSVASSEGEELRGEQPGSNPISLTPPPLDEIDIRELSHFPEDRRDVGDDAPSSSSPDRLMSLPGFSDEPPVDMSGSIDISNIAIHTDVPPEWSDLG